MIAAFMHAFLPLQGDSMVIEYGTGMWAYTLEELSTHSYTYILYICDEIMKGQKKGNCFGLSALVWFQAESLYFPEFLAAEELYATIITEEL